MPQVMPLMGLDVKLPEHAVGSLYKQYLSYDAMDGLFVIEKSLKTDHYHHIKGGLSHLSHPY